MAGRLEKVVAQEVSLLSRYVAEEGHCQRMARGFPRFSSRYPDNPLRSSLLVSPSPSYGRSVLAYTYMLPEQFASVLARSASKLYYCSPAR